jgi:glucokinase
MSAFPRLLGDIGGTNARFAWVAGPGQPPGASAVYPCDRFTSLEAAIEHYLNEHGRPAPRWAAIGIANPVTGDQVRMTNRDWAFSISDMKRRFGLDRLLVINDFTALALALPALQPGDLEQVGGGQVVRDAPVGLLGPGTGLGVSGLIPGFDGRLVPIQGEGGHATLAPADDLEDSVIRILRRRFGHVSAERALSGPGLVNLLQAVCEHQGVAALDWPASRIAAAAVDGSHPQCVAALDLFCSLLGNVAGNVALTLGARGGMFIGGGIVPRLGDWFARSRFRERFEDKGRFRPYLQAIATFVVKAPNPALIGVARALDELP